MKVQVAIRDELWAKFEKGAVQMRLAPQELVVIALEQFFDGDDPDDDEGGDDWKGARPYDAN